MEPESSDIFQKGEIKTFFSHTRKVVVSRNIKEIWDNSDQRRQADRRRQDTS